MTPEQARLERRKLRSDGEAPARIADRPVQGYYNVPMLKAPVWEWMIPSYFFLGGLAGGSYVLARLAERAGGAAMRRVTQAGVAIAAAALAPCPPLLIADLGDRWRFHYMLRVFKPKSPMNLGTWTLTAFSGLLAYAAVRELFWNRSDCRLGPAAQAADAAVTGVTDLLGIPIALLLTGYTGVLLSATSTPVWARSRWLGPLFCASALHSAAEAVELAIESQGDGNPVAADAVRNIAHVTDVAATGALVGYLASGGDAVKPLTRGKYTPHLLLGAVGLGTVVPALLETLPVGDRRTRRALRIGGSLLGLAGAFLIKWAVTNAGHVQEQDGSAALKE